MSSRFPCKIRFGYKPNLPGLGVKIGRKNRKLNRPAHDFGELDEATDVGYNR